MVKGILNNVKKSADLVKRYIPYLEDAVCSPQNKFCNGTLKRAIARTKAKKQVLSN